MSRRGIFALTAAALVAVVTASPVASQQSAGPPMESKPGGRIVLLPGDLDAMSAIPARRLPPAPGHGRDGDAPAQAFTATAQVTYSSLVAGQSFPTAARAAVQAAIDIWMQRITSSVTITVRVNWRHFAEDVLAGAGPSRFYRNFDNAPVADTFYPSALAEALAGHTLTNSDPDVVVDINDRSDWSYNTDGTPAPNKYDLMTTMLHELGHGWGYYGTMNVASGRGTWGGFAENPNLPDIYDRHTEDGSGRELLTYANNSTALATALQGNNVWFSSPQTNEGLADRFKLYAPSPWLAGSSYAHPDEATYGVGHPESLMTPYINRSEVIHDPGPKTLCLLEALGWVTPEACTPGGPPETQPQGGTWYSNGTTAQSGPSSSAVTAYATGVAPGSYKLVTGRDNGTGQPCRYDVADVNPAVRIASPFGLIPNTSGRINRPAGVWQVCFREEGTAGPLSVTFAATFTVTG